MNLPFYTYLIGVCVANICTWESTPGYNKFSSFENCQIAAELLVDIGNQRIIDAHNYPYLKLNYQCYNWWEKNSREFKDRFGYTIEAGY
jgi:hypothetical protein